MREILLLLDQDAGDPIRIAVGQEVASAVGARLTCVDPVACIHEHSPAQQDAGGFPSLDSADAPNGTDLIMLRKVPSAPTRTPILAVPPHVTHLKVAGEAVVLWDGSPDIQSALLALMPLLSRAEHVTLVYADETPRDPSLTQAVLSLACRGVTAHAFGYDPLDDDIVCSIEHYLRRHESAYVVVNGDVRRGSSPFNEVAARLMARPPIPLLLM